MALVTGNLTDFTGAAIPSAAPLIEFVPSSAALYSDTLLSVRPPSVTPAASGEFNINLVPNVLTRPFTWYTPRITFLGTDDPLPILDLPDMKLLVPLEGGPVRDLLITRPSAFMTWYGPTPPPELGDYLWWLDESSGDLYEWSN